MSLFRTLHNFAWRVSLKGLPCGPHITRYTMYNRLKCIGARLPYHTGRVLSIGFSSNLCDHLGIRPTEVVEANEPDHTILALNFEDAGYDFVFSDQVLEHVEGNPQQAIDECYRILKPGGIAVHTTCFINPIHGAPGDFWRFTPDALGLLHCAWSEIIECGGWGNFDVWPFLVRGGDDIRFEGVPHAKWHPLHRLATRNDPIWPLVTWIVARK